MGASSIAPVDDLPWGALRGPGQNPLPALVSVVRREALVSRPPVGREFGQHDDKVPFAFLPMLEHFVQMAGFDLAVIADFFERASLEFRGELRFDGIERGEDIGFGITVCGLRDALDRFHVFTGGADERHQDAKSGESARYRDESCFPVKAVLTRI